MDSFISCQYAIENNGTKLATYISTVVQPLTFGYLHYISLVLLVLCLYMLFALLASARSDRFYTNGYVFAVIIWPTLYSIRLVYHEVLNDIGFSLLGISYAPSFVVFHLLETTSFINLSLCSAFFMASHLLAFIDKQPYSGLLVYVFLWFPSFGLSYGLYYCGIPQIQRGLIMLVSALPILALVAAVALGLMFFLLSGAFSCRISMKKYYKPALLVIISAACQWNAIWIGYRTAPKAFFGPLSSDDFRNIILDWPNLPEFAEFFPLLFCFLFCLSSMFLFVPYRSPLQSLRGLICGRYLKGKMSYPVQHAKKLGGEVVPILVMEVTQDRSSQGSATAINNQKY